jgi:hypothetical protein
MITSRRGRLPLRSTVMIALGHNNSKPRDAVDLLNSNTADNQWSSAVVREACLTVVDTGLSAVSRNLYRA